jgi:hypothetical protein
MGTYDNSGGGPISPKASDISPSDVEKDDQDEAAELYCVTSEDRLDGIKREGLRAGSYWSSNSDLADYYEETVSDEGREPVCLVIDLSELNEAAIVPDYPGLEEPITTVIGLAEKEVQRLWQASGQGWRDCLELIGSIRYELPIPANLLRVVGDDDYELLIDQETPQSEDHLETDGPRRD